MRNNKIIKICFLSIQTLFFIILVHAAGAQDALYIHTNGKVGISTTAPVAQLDINQSRTGSSHPTSVNGLYITGPFAPSSAGVEFRHTNGSQGIGFGYNSIYATGYNADQHLNLIPRGNGNVGIGKTNPGYKLDVNGSFNATSGNFNGGINAKSLTVSDGQSAGSYTLSNLFSGWTGENRKFISFERGVNNDQHRGRAVFYAPCNYYTNVPVMTLLGNYGAGGKVGIGTKSPTYPLHVTGSSATPSNAPESWFRPNTSLSKSGNTNTSAISIFATSYVGSSTGFVAHSDERLKNIYGISKGIDDLNIINRIEITDYTLRDQAKNNQIFKKVIAQQVRTVYPQAVMEDGSSNYIANLYQLVNSFTIEDNIVTMILEKSIENKDIGDIVNDASIKFYLQEEVNSSKTKEMEGIIISIDGNAIRVKVDEALDANNYQQLFAYGTKVNDILSVDYEAISMLNVSATQEISIQMEKLKAENQELIGRLTELENQLEDFENQQNEIAELKLNFMLMQKAMNTNTTKTTSIFSSEK